MTTSPSRRWLITGGSRGFGRAITEAVLAHGDTAVVTARRPDALADLTARGATALALDVTDHEQVRAVVAETAAGGGIDVLVNNAGFGLIGALEELSDAQLRRIMDTNIGGTCAMTRAVLPHMRAARRGHIVQMSSVGGVVANPGHAAYGLTKFAVEGFSEALAGEVAPFGIRVTLVEPGPFRTGFADSTVDFAEPIPDYADTPAGALRARFRRQDGQQPGDPVRAAEAIIATVAAASAPLRLPMGRAAVDRIRAKLTGQLADLDAVEKLATGTDF